MGSARHGVGIRPASGYGDARGLAGYRYLLAVLLLAGVASGATLALMVGTAHRLGYLPDGGVGGPPPSVANPFDTYTPPFDTYPPEPPPRTDHPVPAAHWSMLPV